MNVNDLFAQIGDFWQSIAFPIAFHVLLFIIYQYIFQPLSIKAKIEKYIQGSNFTRTKAILIEFELWTKLPIIILISSLIYLSLFNSLSSFVVNSLSPDLIYSNSDFLLDYNNKQDIYDIALYGKSTHPSVWEVDELIAGLLTEYKAKYSEKFKSSVEYWGDEATGKRSKYLNFLWLLSLAVIIIYIVSILKRLPNRKAGSFKRLGLFIICVLPLLFVCRYRVEQALEEQFVLKVFFVKSSLANDVARKSIFTQAERETLANYLAEQLSQKPAYRSGLWVSNLVSHSEALQVLLGQRVLRRGIDEQKIRPE